MFIPGVQLPASASKVSDRRFGYAGPRHFDAHAYRTEDYDGVRDFARGCMRTYLILKERAAQWNADPEIQALVAAFGTRGQRGLGYEKLDQLTMELLLGVRA